MFPTAKYTPELPPKAIRLSLLTQNSRKKEERNNIDKILKICVNQIKLKIIYSSLFHVYFTKQCMVYR